MRISQEANFTWTEISPLSAQSSTLYTELSVPEFWAVPETTYFQLTLQHTESLGHASRRELL